MLHLSSRNFEEETGKGTPIIVDFFADWCGPCRQLAPIFEELSGDYKGKLNFGKLNTDENPGIPQKFGVMGIPCLIVIKKGKEAGRIVGFMPKDKLKAEIDRILAKL